MNSGGERAQVSAQSRYRLAVGRESASGYGAIGGAEHPRQQECKCQGAGGRVMFAQATRTPVLGASASARRQ